MTIPKKMIDDLAVDIGDLVDAVTGVLEHVYDPGHLPQMRRLKASLLSFRESLERCQVIGTYGDSSPPVPLTGTVATDKPDAVANNEDERHYDSAGRKPFEAREGEQLDATERKNDAVA